MEHDAITLHTLAGQATVAAPPEPMVTHAGGSVTAAEIECEPSDPAPQPPDPAEAQQGLAEPPDLERLGNQIAELSSRIDAATYELLCHLREFDRRYGWEGFRSCAHWLNYRTGLALGAAREKLRVATALADLNHVSAAMARGQLSYSKVRALTRVATPATEARLLAVALSATAAHVERLARAWRRADRAAAADAERDLLASRALSMRVDEDGMVVVRGRLPAEVGAVLLRAVEAALEQVPASAVGDGGEAGDDATIAQRRADALGLVAESALAGGLDPGTAADRFQVTVHVPVHTLTSRVPTGTAPRVSAGTLSISPAVVEPAGAAANQTPHVAVETQPSPPAARGSASTPPAQRRHVPAEVPTAQPMAAPPLCATADPAPHVADETRPAQPAAHLSARAAADPAAPVSAETRLTHAAAGVPASAVAQQAPQVPAETRPTQPAAPAQDGATAYLTPHVPAEAPPTHTPAEAPGSTAVDQTPHVFAETQRAQLAAGQPVSATEERAPQVSAETRPTQPAVGAPTSTTADPAPHVPEDARPAQPEADLRLTAAADPVPHTPTASRATRSPRPVPPSAEADPAPHVPAETQPTQPAAAAPLSAAADASRPTGAAGWSLAAGPSAFGTAHGSEGRFEASEDGAGPTAVTDPDAGQAVIEQAGGLHLGREAARRLACDAGLVCLLHDGSGGVLDIGRRSRTVPSSLRRALASRDRGQCRFPGCESRHCDVHHVEHWADGGETRLSNLVSLCRFHHRAVHEEGFRVVPGAGETEGQFRFLRPNGDSLPAEPPPACWQGAALAPTEQRLAAAGVDIGPHTGTPDWFGEPLDLQAALDVLWEPPTPEGPQPHANARCTDLP